MYSAATFYVDDGSVSNDPGSNAVRATLTGVVFSNPSGEIVRGLKAGHGLATGAVVTVSGCSEAYANDRWKIEVFDVDNFDLVGAFWSDFNGADVTGDVVPAGGSSWADAWATLEGATTDRTQAGDTVLVAKTAAPTNIGNADWFTGPVAAAKAIDTSSNTTPIVVEVLNHGFTSGDIVRVSEHQVNTAANGVWKIIVLDDDSFELIEMVSGDDSVGNGSGLNTGYCRVINSQVVELSVARNKTISRCETAWTVAGGFIQTLDAIPTVAGSGYAVDEILTLTTGSGDATARVTSVSTSGPVTSASGVFSGSGYIMGDIVTVSGGGFNCQLNVNAVGGMGEISAVSISVAGTNYTPGVYFVAGGSGSGGTVNIDSVGSGAVLAVALEDQTVFGDYIVEDDIPTTSSGSGTGCTLEISAVSDSCTLSAPTGANGKLGESYVSFTMGPYAGAPVRLAYESFPAVDLSDYRELTFWIQTSTPGGLAVGAFVLGLCSDTEGKTIVDAFNIPAIAVEQRWVPLSRVRNGGKYPLGASIQSVALYGNVGASVGDNISFDCIATALDGDLCLTSVISKSGLATPASQGVVEPAWILQAIDEQYLFLGNTPLEDIAPTGGVKAGYRGTSGTFVSYQRRGVPMLGGQELQAGGSRSAPLTFIGGVNTSTDLVDGETLYDGQTGLDNGLLIEQSYTRASGFAFTRYSRAVRYQNGAHDNVLEYARAIGATDSGLYFFESNKNHVDRFIVSGASVGVEFEHASRNTVGLLQAAFQCGAGLRFVEGAQENSVLNAAIDDCFVGCQAFGTQNMLSDTLLSRCEVGYDIGYGINLARRISFSGCTTDVSPWSADPFRVARLQVEDYANGGENRSFEFGGEIVSLPTDRSGGSGRMWRTSFPTVFSVGRPFDHPVVLAVARVPLVADQPTTLNAYVRKSHATNVGAVLACRGGQIAGIPSDVTDEAAESTGWQVLSIKITASAQGVVEIELRSYRLASGAVGYVDIDQIERGT